VIGIRSYSLLTVALLAVLSACGGDGDEAAPPPPATSVETRRCAPVAFEPLVSPRRAFGAAARRDVVVYARPGGRAVERFRRINPNGVPTVFGVLGRRVGRDCRPSWYRVRLPRRPNGRVGWVRASDVTVGSVRTRLLVDLSARQVTLYRDGRKVLSTPAAIGSAATPTPTGTYYVDQRLYAPDPTGPFGPAAVGIAAYSNVLTGWAQGGPIAIHGTNRPDLIGQAVSNGCVRVRNDVLRRIFAATLSGTPVVIQA
jgi:hypothetical protein